MFYFKLNQIKIEKNGEGGVFSEKNEAEVELWSIVATNNTALPSMGDFLAANNSSQRREIAKALVEDFMALIEVPPIEHVEDGGEIHFGDVGYAIYKSQQVPEELNWNLIAIDVDQEERDRGEMVKSLLDRSEFDDLTIQLETVVNGVPDPTFKAVTAVGRFVANGLVQKWRNSDDDLIGNLLMSLNRRVDYRNGKRKAKDVPDLTNNMKVDYALYTTDA